MDIKQISSNIPAFIDLKDIDEVRCPYCMSFGFDIKPLIDSIKSFGVINMPFIARNEEGTFDIVAGYRRIMALKALNCEKVQCIDLSSSGLSQLDLLLFNLYDNLPTRKFNDVEKGMILKRLILYVPKKEIQEYYMPLLNIANRRDLDIFLKIEELTDQIKRFIAHGIIPLKIMHSILELDDRSLSVVCQRISDLRLNFNQQLKFIEYLIDISIKKGCTIYELFEEDQILRLLKDKKLNSPQKAKKIIDYLRARRFPLLIRNENAFLESVASLNLPDNVSIRYPPYFEAPGYRLEVNFGNGKELVETIETLANIEGMAKIGDPWDEES